jgi:hypothetical protein
MGQNGVLYGLDPATGRVRQQATIGAPANHFPTPSVGDGLLLAASADQVVAFAAPAPGATSTATPVTSSAQAHATPAASAHRPQRYLGLGWFLSRRLRRIR